MTIDPKAFLAQVAADPELAAQLRAVLGVNTPSPAPAPVQAPASPSGTDPLPDIKDITLLQATLFDNGPDNVRAKYKPRYRVTLEVWTEQPHLIRLSEWTWKRSVTLIGNQEVKNRITTLKNRGSISADYYDLLFQSWQGVPLEYTFGLIGDKGDRSGSGQKGTSYYDGQFIMVEMKDGAPANAHLVRTSNSGAIDTLDFGYWAMTNSRGNLLKDSARYQSRIDRCHYNAAWGTQPAPDGE